MSNISIDSILQASNAIIINPSKSLKDFGIDDPLLLTSPILFIAKNNLRSYPKEKARKRT